jgi:hypothetical protein
MGAPLKRLGRTVVSMSTAIAWRYEALLAGADYADLSRGCERPVVMAFVGVDDKLVARLKDNPRHTALRNMVTLTPVMYSGGVRDTGSVVNADVRVPCGRCATCLKRRAAFWRMRALHEIVTAKRTWFSTFTAAPAAQWAFASRAHVKERDAGSLWLSLTATQRFDALALQFYREFQLYVKRLRKQGVKCRYLTVIERHTGHGQNHGLPHLHALIHEVDAPIRHKVLNDNWRLGFSTHKLVGAGDLDNSKAAAYVCKYLTKEFSNKPRASLRYGRDDS